MTNEVRPLAQSFVTFTTHTGALWVVMDVCYDDISMHG